MSFLRPADHCVRSVRLSYCIATILVFLASALPCAAQQGSAEEWREHIPTALEAWVPWVSRSFDDDQEQCFSKVHAHRTFLCVWMPKLELSLSDDGATASVIVAVDAEKERVVIPGGQGSWPQSVTREGVAQAILDIAGRPAVELSRGLHPLEVKYRWERIPAIIPAPASVVMFSLSVNGEAVAFPKRQADGAIWTERREEVAQTETLESDSIEVEVFRRLFDGIPQRLETQLLLRVAGKPRELAVPISFFKGELFQVPATLPVNVLNDKVSIQIQPGTWRLSFFSYLEDISEQFSFDEREEPWPRTEFWALHTQNELRTIDVQGGTPISIEQTNAPSDWRGLPLFALSAGETLELVEQRRGGTKASHDALQLQKQLWLAFDGESFTVKDTINGQIADAGRLNFTADGSLGRVTINSVEQYITRLEDGGPVGVEIREGQLDMLGESKQLRQGELLPGWNRDFDSFRGSLSLPPGWSVFSSSGVDWISKSWVQSWSLLNLFLVLVTAVASYRLFGPVVGGLTLLMLVLVEPEQSFSVSLLVFFAFAALAGALPQGGVRKMFRSLALLAILGVSLQTLMFSIEHLRSAMFPQLKGFYLSDPYASSTLTSFSRGEAYSPAPQAAKQMIAEESMEMEAAFDSRLADGVGGVASSSAPKRRKAQALNQYLNDKNLTTQTGYGLANWTSSAIHFGRNGPITAKEQFGFRLLSPGVNLFLAFIRVLLLVLVLAWSAMRVKDRLFLVARSSAAPLSWLLVLLTLAAAAPQEVRAENEIPSQQLLQELQQYIRSEREKAPECEPYCVSISEVTVEDAAANGLLLRFRVNAAENTALPLLARSDFYSVSSVSLADKSTARLTEDGGMLWIGMPKGVWQTSVELKLAAVRDLGITFGTRPARVEMRSSRWKADSLRDGSLSGDTLSLRRVDAVEVEPSDASTAAAEQPEQKDTKRLAPLFRVERTISFEVNWTVQTQVIRLSPADRSVQIAVPLLEGEAVTSGGVQVADGRAQVEMPTGVTNVSWTSSLSQTDQLVLTAADEVPWSELWRVNASNLWHVSFDGTPRIYSDSAVSYGMPEWQPRPGETLTLSITQPQGVQGPTTTIDEVSQRYDVGARLTQVTLDYSIRSSKGVLQELRLPKGAELNSLTVNGQTRPLRVSDGLVKIDLAPGAQEVQLKWREQGDLPVSFSNEAANLGFPAVNVKSYVQYPANRWVLLLGGPAVGPVVLFWSTVPIVFLVAFLLSRWKRSPLRFYEWVLLLLGLSQVGLSSNIIIVAWFVLFALRRSQEAPQERKWGFRLQQVILAGLTLMTISSLFGAIRHGLLSSPTMKIQGVQSSAYSYFWFEDAVAGALSEVWVLSLHVFWYRAVMMVWALWLSFAAIRWLRWGWESFSSNGIWISFQRPEWLSLKRSEPKQ